MADILEKLSADAARQVFEHLDNPQAAEAISELEDEFQADVIDDLANQRASDILGMMDPDDAADIIGDLPYDKAEMLLRLMGVKESRAIRSLLGYKEKTAGGIMTPEVTTVTEDMTVQQVIEFLRGEAAEHESIYYIFVIEGDTRLARASSHCATSSCPSPDTCVERHRAAGISSPSDADDDQEDVAETMSKYDLLALPVIDESGRLLGIVTVDDALESSKRSPPRTSQLATGSVRKWESGAMSWLGKKSGWLIVWLVLGVGASLVLAAFSDTLATFVPVVLFIPLVIRMSEDISSHSLAVLIDAGSAEERPNFGRHLVIDMVVGLGLGIISGLYRSSPASGDAHHARGLDRRQRGRRAHGATHGRSRSRGALPRDQRDGSGWRAPSVLISTGIAAVGLSVYLGCLATCCTGSIQL